MFRGIKMRMRERQVEKEDEKADLFREVIKKMSKDDVKELFSTDILAHANWAENTVYLECLLEKLDSNDLKTNIDDHGGSSSIEQRLINQCPTDSPLIKKIQMKAI